MGNGQFVILCAGKDDAGLQQLRDDVDRITGAPVSVEAYHTGGRVRGRLRELLQHDTLVPVVLIDEELRDGPGTDALVDMEADPGADQIRKILVISLESEGGLSAAVRAHALDATLVKPVTEPELTTTLQRLVTQYFVREEPEALERLPHLVDVGILAHALTVARERYRSTADQLNTVKRSFLADLDLSDDEVEAAMISEIERVLQQPERQTFPGGSTIKREGEHLDGLMVVLSGTLQLTRNVGGVEHIFHSRTAGRILGLSSLARSQPGPFTVKAVTDVEVIPITLDELDEALQESPILAVHFVTVLLRSLARRHVRSMELQVENERLVREARS